MPEALTDVPLGIDVESTFDPAQALRLDEARKLLRGRKGHPHPNVVRRWANPRRGCRIGGQVLVLPVVKVGGELLLMPAWCEAFERARARLGQRPAADLPRTPKQRQRAWRAAEERLRAAGI